MAENIVMPQLGESIAEGTIVKWLKKPGDKVEKDENILLISTDKVEAEIPSPTAGILVSIDVQEGATVDIGTVLGTVGAEGEAPAAPAKKEAAPVPDAPKEAAQAPTATPTPSAEPVAAPQVPVAQASASQAGRFLSPLVKRIAHENNVAHAELDGLAGSGRDNRVTKKDLLGYIDDKNSGRVSAPVSVAAATTSAPAPAQRAGLDVPTVVFPSGQNELRKPISTMRRVIMENMLRSKKESAHVTTFFEVDYSQIDQVRSKHKAAFKAQEGVSLTYTTFLTAAICQTLKRHPYINAEIKDGEIVFKKDIHLGIAVAITSPEPGLMVPVIKHADRLNLRGLAASIKDLADRTRIKRIKPDELSGGTFTLTNPGNFGAVIGTPIINQPQVAILGVGQIKKQAIVLEVGGTDVIAIRPMGWLSLSFDHRLIDGATADMFMSDLKATLENWKGEP